MAPAPGADRPPAPSVQLRRAERAGDGPIDPADLLTSALAKLARGVERLNREVVEEPLAACGADGEDGGSSGAAGREGSGSGAAGAEAGGRPGMMLFAGRRSSSRRYLLLQNWWVNRLWRRPQPAQKAFSYLTQRGSGRACPE